MFCYFLLISFFFRFSFLSRCTRSFFSDLALGFVYRGSNSARPPAVNFYLFHFSPKRNPSYMNATQSNSTHHYLSWKVRLRFKINSFHRNYLTGTEYLGYYNLFAKKKDSAGQKAITMCFVPTIKCSNSCKYIK